MKSKKVTITILLGLGLSLLLLCWLPISASAAKSATGTASVTFSYDPAPGLIRAVVENAGLKAIAKFEVDMLIQAQYVAFDNHPGWEAFVSPSAPAISWTASAPKSYIKNNKSVGFWFQPSMFSLPAKWMVSDKDGLILDWETVYLPP